MTFPFISSWLKIAVITHGCLLNQLRPHVARDMLSFLLLQPVDHVYAHSHRQGQARFLLLRTAVNVCVYSHRPHCDVL